jgi:hypothetical protein
MTIIAPIAVKLRAILASSDSNDHNQYQQNRHFPPGDGDSSKTKHEQHHGSPEGFEARNADNLIHRAIM